MIAMRPVIYILLILILAACVTGPQSPNGGFDSRSMETADLANIADAVLQAHRQSPDAQILVVFDLDNTLMAMEQGLGADQWYDWQRSLAQADDCSPARVVDRLAAQGALYYASAMRPTQPDAAEVVERIQQSGLPVIALTARGNDFRLQTFRELRRNGFNFRDSAFGPTGGYRNALDLDGFERDIRFEDGVMMVAGQNKGAALLQILSHTDTPRPDLVVMVDDKDYNLDNVTTALTGAGIAVHAWRYSGEDEAVANFDPTLAEIQWQTVAPALEILEAVFGPDHYDLPEMAAAPGCLP